MFGPHEQSRSRKQEPKQPLKLFVELYEKKPYDDNIGCGDRGGSAMTMKRDITVDGKMSLVSGVRRFFVITAITISAGLALGGCNHPYGHRSNVHAPYDPTKYHTQYYQTDFNTVWAAAIVALHRNRYIIDLMSTREGYISAHLDRGSEREEVGISISNAEDLVRISINLSVQLRSYSKETKSYVWMEWDPKNATEWLHKAIASLLELEQTKSEQK